MPETVERLDITVIEDPSGTEIKLMENVKSEWCKELLIKSRPSKGVWGNFFYITGPVEAREIAEFIRTRVDEIETIINGDDTDENHYRRDAFPTRKKNLKGFRISGRRDTRQANFCWSRIDDLNSLRELADIIENWQPIFN